MFRMLRKSLKTGIVTGRHDDSSASAPAVADESAKTARRFQRSLAIREVDTGSCNGCEMEMNALMNPVYDAERFGLHIAASPRHADALVVTGPVTVNMEKALKDAHRTTPAPKLVIALGDCACDCGMFKGSYAVTGPVERHVPVDVKVPGCPPRPTNILQALQCLMGSWGRMSAVLLLAGLVGLGGCSQKSVTATTSEMETIQGAAKPGAGTDEPRRPAASQPAESRPVEPGDRSPLQGFSSPSRAEEVITAPAPIVAAKADQPAGAPAAAATHRVLANIYFAFDKWALSKEGKKNLAVSAEALKQRPSAKLLIEGHCDERGSGEYNLVLGEKRAKEALRYLEALGIKNPVAVTSYGKERPVCAERNESCYWKNRRAHLVLEESR